MDRFSGSLEDLQGLLSEIAGDWSSGGNDKHTFRTKEGGILNWWESKGTVQLQGSDAGRLKIRGALEVGSVYDSGTNAGTTPHVQKRRIFIVHGHDTEARDQMELALHRLSLDPFILMNNSGGGLTIIEALEGQIGKDYSTDFGIVLMTPDDFGYAKMDGKEKLEPRVRQNVLLETGMLLSSLTRARIAIVVKGHVDIPSDLQGIIRLGYNDHIREIVPKLCQRLRDAGFDIDTSKLASASQ
jgi:predicted nucleotide-binding protein